MKKLVFGVGLNDSNYPIDKREIIDGKVKQVWRCPFYARWINMLQRCYSEKFLIKNLTYRGCTVCDEWLIFSNFRTWMEAQNWQGRQLDKDFLLESNKHYSPRTCLFIPQKLNSFITTALKSRGDLPLGVRAVSSTRSTNYKAECNNGNGKTVSLGYYKTPYLAHEAWLIKKLEICEDYLIEFSAESLVCNGLARIKAKIENCLNSSKELKTF